MRIPRFAHSHPDRSSVSRRRRQGPLHRASWRHARRDTARPRDPVLSALRGGDIDLRQRRGGRDLANDARLWRAVRLVLLCDVRTDITVAAQALDLDRGRGGRVVGHVRDRRAAPRVFGEPTCSTAQLPAGGRKKLKNHAEQSGHRQACGQPPRQGESPPNEPHTKTGQQARVSSAGPAQ